VKLGVNRRRRAKWAASLDHVSGLRQHRGRDREAERLRGLQVDHELELRGLLDGEGGGLGTF
jgi:hypothetical protein